MGQYSNPGVSFLTHMDSLTVHATNVENNHRRECHYGMEDYFGCFQLGHLFNESPSTRLVNEGNRVQFCSLSALASCVSVKGTISSTCGGQNHLHALSNR